MMAVPVMAQETGAAPVAPNHLEAVMALIVGLLPAAATTQYVMEAVKPHIQRILAKPDHQVHIPAVTRGAAFLVGCLVVAGFYNMFDALPYVEALPQIPAIIFMGFIASFDSNVLHRLSDFLQGIGVFLEGRGAV